MEKPRKLEKTTDELYFELEDLIAEFTDEKVSDVRKALDRLFDSVKPKS